MTKLHPTELAESKPDYGKPPERWYKEIDDPFKPKAKVPAWLLGALGVAITVIAALTTFGIDLWRAVTGAFMR